MLSLLVGLSHGAEIALLHASEVGDAIETAARDARERERDLVPRTLSDFAPSELAVLGAEQERCDLDTVDVLTLQESLTQADLLLTKGRSAKARAVLQRATAQFVCLDRWVEPSSAARVWLLLGIASQIEGDPQAALAAFQQALIYRPDLLWDSSYTPAGEELFLQARVSNDRGSPGRLSIAPGVDPTDVRVDGYPVADGETRLVPGAHLVQTSDRTLQMNVAGGEHVWLVDGASLPTTLLEDFQDPRVSSFLEVLLAGSGPLYVESAGRTWIWDGVDFQLLATRRDPAPWVLSSGVVLAAAGGGMTLWQVQRGRQAIEDGEAAIAGLNRGAHGTAEDEWAEARQLTAVGIGLGAVGVGLAGTGVLMLSPGSVPAGVTLTVRR